MQIAAAPPAGQQVHGVLDLDMCRKDEDRRLGKLLTDDACGVKTLSRMRGRHPNVDEGELWPLLSDQGDQLLAVTTELQA
jgi:hypothetical protein